IDADLADVVGKRGVAVGVPYYYKDSDVDNVVKAIQGKYKPTPRPPTTTRRPTTSRPSTTPKPRQLLKCLFVADLFNFGKDADKYHDEAELINAVGYDFFTSDEIMPSAGLWAYGYTTFPKSPDLSRVNGSHDEFIKDLEKLEFTEAGNNVSTSR
ncbi:hypothetical protein OESDEN_23533, partial [Oesophagostomum dentatum]